MDIDEPDLTERKPGESLVAFEARLRMLRRVGPVVQRLTEHGFAIVVESERRSQFAEEMDSDLIIEYGDVRIRVLLFPGETAPMQGQASRDRLAHYFLDVPDADAVAVVSDDDVLSTWMMDVYDANDPSRSTMPLRPFADAIATFFSENVFALELPDFRTVLALPSEVELRARIERSVLGNFDRIKAARARIPEKIAALETLGPEDIRRLVSCLTGVLDGHTPGVEGLLGRDDSTGS